MRPATWLRIASVLILVHVALHAVATLGKPQPGAQQAAVAAMQSNQFLLMGFTRSFWNFQQGYNWALTVLLCVEAVILWQLSRLGEELLARLVSVLATISIGFAVMAVGSYMYFFPPPAITELVIAACIGAAALASKKQLQYAHT